MKGQRSHLNDPKHERSHELDTSDIHTPGVQHEEGDINVTPVYKFLLVLGGFMVLSYLIVYGILRMNDARIAKEAAVVTHVSKSKLEELPPEPRLQLSPGSPLHPLDEGLYYRDSVMKQLQSYGYVNKPAGTVHIPIELAKELLLKKGLAVRAGSTDTNAGVIMIPDWSSSGRVAIRREARIPGGTYTVTGGNMNVENGF
ncbi:MAG TPA: hypothetical protein VGM92_15305 [Candidatus Kapabacteria bacterium]|jgi:hypothetical protein